MFDVHQIERDYENIDIKDEAFVSLFEFFDKWRWHLDTRVTELDDALIEVSEDNDIRITELEDAVIELANTIAEGE